MLGGGFLVADLLFRHTFALLGERLESWRDINEPHDAFLQLVHLRNRARPTRADDHAGVALVPIDAIGLDHVVEHPALLVEALHHRPALGLPETPVARAGGRA